MAHFTSLNRAIRWRKPVFTSPFIWGSEVVRWAVKVHGRPAGKFEAATVRYRHLFSVYAASKGVHSRTDKAISTSPR